MKEKWLPIKGFENYHVSNLGKIKSVDSYKTNSLGHVRFIKGKEIKGYIDQDGYTRVIIYPMTPGWKNRKKFYVHALVLEAFVGPRKKRISRHLDGNPQNNNLKNLCWGTCKQNKADSIRHGTHRMPQGAKSKCAALTQAQADKIKEMKGKCTQKYLAEKYKVSRITIHRIWTGKRYV